MTKKQQFAILLAVNVFIALAFFLNNLGVGPSAFSSDQHNIVAMCLKLDNPNLFQKDVFLDDVANFRYYIPFFIQTLRGIAWITGGDYILALNLWNTFTHVLFGLTWFLLGFYVLKRRFWIALFLSILIRGVVWLPGYEFWGISDLWAFTPRTFFAALLPIPFILLFTQWKHKLLWANLCLGLILNWHPISGIGAILLFYSFLLGSYLFNGKRTSLSQFFLGVGLLLLGMFPFLARYFFKIDMQANYDTQIYNAAFLERLPAFFQDPVLFLKQWKISKILFFITPLVVLFFIGFFKNKTFVKYAAIVACMALVVFVFPMVLFPLENWLNEAYGLNIRMAFQLIRIQKMTILPLYFSIGFLFLFVYEQFQRVKKWSPWVVGVYFLLVILAQPKTFKGVFFVSDDITTRILPKWQTLFLPFEERKTSFDKMAAYVAAETPEQAVFYKNYRIRAAASKSVLMDTKGPGMLIEGNPQKLVSWYRTYEKVQVMKSPEKWEALKQLGVTHVLLRKDPKEDYLMLLHQEGAYLLFKIK